MTISGGLVPAGDPKGDGGGVESDGNELRLVNDVLTGNQAAVSGGAVANQSGSLYVIDTTIAGNTALHNGGAIRGYNAVILQGATISGNHAGGGGGGIDSTDQLLATNATIAGNSAEFGAGGLRGGDKIELFSSTVAGNGTHKGTGGNLDGEGASVFLTDSILANPTAGGNCHATVSADHSLIDHTGGCTVTGSGNVVGQDPMLGPLHANGGRTATMALSVGSPAINAGTSTACPETDQRGVMRPQGQHCDIGAYETPFPEVTGPTAAVVHTAKFTVAWEVTGGGPAAKFFDVRYRDRLPGHPFGAFHDLVLHTTAHHKGFTGTFGREYCFSADAFDPGGNISPFGPQHCVTVSH
jgi:predicted outer membrane repeat protein